ncbi:WxL protein peptidoglycan domain-containing protein [Schleiferilactobacillus shenzhenensis]|uniref:WxL protein peptidoglycan domain-containing protein n=1 Tax=Schleiferilactobacillus shenzhenensis TaxID=1231337 RepID=UPI000591506A|nr:DUF916 domain-containing protein [Schleiferilactobacillus shenzhenensis]
MKHGVKDSLLICLGLLLALIIGNSVTQVNAATGPGFSMAPVYPSNQITKDSGAFNLLVKPASTQPLSIKVVNSEDQKRTIRFVLNLNYAQLDQNLD